MPWRNFLASLGVFRTYRTPRVLLLSFSVLVAIALLAAGFFYSQVVRVVREDTIASYLAQLRRAQNELDQDLQLVETYVLRLALNRRIAGLANTTDVLRGSRIMDVRDAWLELSSRPVPTDLIAQLFVYYGPSNVVLTPEVPYVRLSFFDRDFFELGGLTFSEWERRELEGLTGQQYLPARPATLDGKSYLLAPYVRAFPLGESGQPSAYIIAFLDVQRIGEGLLMPGSGGRLQIAAGGRVIAQIPSGSRDPVPDVLSSDPPSGFHEQTIEGREMAIFHAVSAASPWRLTVALPLRTALGRAYFVRNLFAVGAILLVLLGALAAILMARWITMPVRRLLESFSERTGGTSTPSGDEFRFLEQTLVSLVQKNRDLSAVVERQAPLSRQVFVDRLLKGELTAPEEITSLSRETGLALEAPAFVVLLLRVNGYQGVVSRKGMAALSLCRAAVRTVCGQRHGGRIVLHEVDLDKMAMLMSLPTADPQTCRREAEEVARGLRAALKESYDISTTMSAGSIVGSAAEICNSFNEAKYSLGQLATGPSAEPVQWFGAHLPADHGYYYPIEVEYRIITLTKAGDLPSIGKLLDTISEENFTKRRLGGPTAQELIAELSGTLIKSAAEVREVTRGNAGRSPPVAPAPLDLSADIPQIMAQVRAEFARLCAEVNERKKSRNWQLKESIVAYVASEYADPGMCLASVSSKFNLNDIYLSQFFKEQVGENFHHYLERLRMEKARELLSTTDLSVNEVSRRVGYYSAATFRKAFRRIDGTSPLTLRRKEMP